MADEFNPYTRKEYGLWKNMIGACSDPNHKAYPFQGKHGVYMCKSWKNSRNGYLNFLYDMGTSSYQKFILKRIHPNNKGFYNQNAFWENVDSSWTSEKFIKCTNIIHPKVINHILKSNNMKFQDIPGYDDWYDMKQKVDSDEIYLPWRYDFASFINHLGPKPLLGHLLYDPQDIVPGNIRWFDPDEIYIRNRQGYILISN